MTDKKKQRKALRDKINNRLEDIREAYMPDARSYMPDATITLTELIKAVSRMDKATHGPVALGEYWTHETFARALFRYADDTTTGGNTVFDTKNANETLTVAELDKALKGLGYTVALHADEVYARVVANREPEWHAGDIVRSSSQNAWVRTEDGDWKELGRLNGVILSDRDISRPLTLVGRTV